MTAEETFTETIQREAFQFYMRGWKHGATATEQSSVEKSYLYGYADGTVARQDAVRRTLMRLGATQEEAARWILR